MAITASKRRRIYHRDGYRCLNCGTGELRALTLDHIKPLSRGGTSRLDNLQTLCGTCNRKKGRLIIDYREERSAPQPPRETSITIGRSDRA